MYYLEPLALSTSTTSPKIHGIQRLLKLDIPTVKLPFVSTTELFQDYYDLRVIPMKARIELGHVFATIGMGGAMTLRYSAYESNNLELTFIAHTTLNVRSFPVFERILESNYKLLASKVINQGQAEIQLILHSYYKSIKCGSLTNDGSIIEVKAILGEHTRALQLVGIQPDIYRSTSSLSSLKLASLGNHARIFKVSRHGLKTIENRSIPHKKPILSPLQLKKLASWSRLIAKHHGTHTLYFAELTTGELIVQNLLTKKEEV